MNPELLKPGCYSLFILMEDGTWIQPTYRISESMSERDFEMKAIAKHHKVLITCGMQEDDDCPKEFSEELK